MPKHKSKISNEYQVECPKALAWTRSDKKATGFTVLCTTSCNCPDHHVSNERPQDSSRSLANLHRLSDPNLGHSPAHDRRDLPHLFHQLIELIGKQRLRTIGHRLIGLVVHFNH